ncbi:amidase [Marinimicrococcus flavescens]
MMNELIRMSAREAVRRLEAGEVTPLQLIDAAVARIEEVEPVLNAVPTLCVERARTQAKRIMAGEITPTGDGRGWLAGLPVVIKDLNEVEGVRTTHGSPIFADHVPTSSGYEVERLEAHGAVILGKSNTPEFGAGAQTFNEVFGVTRNPWNTALTCGGSSGGAAVALAAGEIWLANGSDLGGSLRTPAGYCSVVGLRPSPGRVPHGPGGNPFGTLSVEGPMGRDVRDVALLLDAQAGHDPRDPLSYPAPARPYAETVEDRPTLRRVAYSADLGGITPVDPEVAAICRAAAERFAGLGVEVIENSCPDLDKAVDVFNVLRAENFVISRAPLLEKHRDKLKPEVIWNIERGLELSAGDIGRAERDRAAMQRSMAAFLDEHDLLLCPTSIVPPFPVEQRYIEELHGHRFPSYIDWVSITFAITVTGCPVLSLPCGFTSTGLPVGLQLVGKPRDEAGLLAAAAMLEDALGIARQVPLDPRRPG